LSANRWGCHDGEGTDTRLAEPDTGDGMAILDRIIQKRVEAKKRLRAYQVRLIANRILEALQSRPEGMTWAEIRGLFDKKQSDKQIRQALLNLRTTALTIQKTEKHGDHSDERWSLLAVPSVASAGQTTLKP